MDTSLEQTSERIEGSGDEQYVCMPIINDHPSDMEYSLQNLPADFIEEHASQLKESNRIIKIHGGSLVIDQDTLEFVVQIPPNALLELVRESRVVPFSTSDHVTKNMLILRVSTTDSEPTLSADEMREKNFGDASSTSISLRSQYRACSFNKLTFDPATVTLVDGTVVEGGVLDIELDIPSVGSSRQTLTNYAKMAAKQLLLENYNDQEEEEGELSDAEGIDNVMICHAPGSNTNPNGQAWLAYSFLDYHISVYNDLRCGYVSATMHEVAHNFGFRHSNEEGEYKDKTGYMGFSYRANDWPRMCFNGHKNYLSGWFNDRIISIDPNEGPWQGIVATFVDYPLAREDEAVVLRVGDDLYLQYNRAKGMNSQTQEYPDMLTIVQDEETSSELMGALDGRAWNTTLYYHENWGDDGESLYIVVCGTHLGDNATTPDYMWVSVQLNGYECSPEQDRSNTLVPSSAPTETMAPSPSPSRTPSADPTWIAPDRGGACDDDMETLFWVGEGVGLENCHWLKGQSSETRDLVCITSDDAYDTCAETCGRCTDSCADNPWFFFEIVEDETIQQVGCHWLAGQDEDTIADTCVWGGSVFGNCRETCNSCPASELDGHLNCDDSPLRSFYVPSLDLTKRCFWLKNNVEYQEELCSSIDSPAFHLCPETCGKCFDYCKNDDTVTFEYDGTEGRSCAWLSGKNLLWEDACAQDDIWQACRETCENCES